MEKQGWKQRIEQACKEAGTYESHFEDLIETLAGILENRDRAQKQFESMNSNPVVMHTNKAGAVNMVKNPALIIINEMNAQALQFWRELGLTPKGFQAMQKNGFKKAEASFEELLSNIGI